MNNSPYTTALIDNIKTPGVEIREMLAKMSKQVEALTDGRQEPWISISAKATEEFFFGGR